MFVQPPATVDAVWPPRAALRRAGTGRRPNAPRGALGCQRHRTSGAAGAALNGPDGATSPCPAGLDEHALRDAVQHAARSASVTTARPDGTVLDLRWTSAATCPMRT